MRLSPDGADGGGAAGAPAAAAAKAAPAANPPADDGASLLPGRAEALKELATNVMEAFPNPGEVPDAPAQLPAGGEKPKNDLSQQPTPDPKKGAGAADQTKPIVDTKAEPQWTAEQTAWFAKAEAAKTPEEQAAVQAAAPEFSAEEVASLNGADNTEVAAAPKLEAGEDHLKDDAELKGQLPADVQDRVNRRIGKEVAKSKAAAEQAQQLTAEVEQLRQQLTQRQARPDVPTAGPLEAVVDKATLQAAITNAETALDQADDLMFQLESDPAGVEQVFRKGGLVLKNEAGEEDYSPARMKAQLTAIRRNADRTLRRDVPKRVEFLNTSEAYANEVKAVLPEIFEKGSERRKLFDTTVAAAPWLKSRPSWVREAAVYALGLEAYQKLQGTKATPAPAKKKLPIPVKIPSPRGAALTPRQPPRGEITPEVETQALNGDKKSRLAIINQYLPKTHR